MNLTPMRFKEYTWPHNPETYAVEYRRTLAAHKIPFGRCVLQDLGETFRVLEGEGTFVGNGAYEEFRRLEKVFEEGGSGVLIHPVWAPARAFFVSLRLMEKPLPDYVRYRFSFWEEIGTGGGELQRVELPEGQQKPAVPEVEHSQGSYIVRKGDTLWGIAREHGVSLGALIRANPGIKNPNRIYPGNRVNIP